MELIEQLGLEVSEEPEIPEEHKEIVRERIRKSNKNPDRLLDFLKEEPPFLFTNFKEFIRIPIVPWPDKKYSVNFFIIKAITTNPINTNKSKSEKISKLYSDTFRYPLNPI